MTTGQFEYVEAWIIWSTLIGAIVMTLWNTSVGYIIHPIRWVIMGLLWLPSVAWFVTGIVVVFIAGFEAAA